MPKTESDAGEKVTEYGEWTGWVKKSERDRWWWSLKRGERTVARAPAGVKMRAEASNMVRTLVSGLMAGGELRQAKADEGSMQIRLESALAREAEKDAALKEAKSEVEEAVKRSNESLEAMQAAKRGENEALNKRNEIEHFAQRDARDAAARSKRKTALMVVVGIVALAIGYVLGAVV